MKNLLYTFTILVAGTAFAQDNDNPVDYMETTKVKTEMVKQGDKMVQTKVKVITKKEQEVKTDPNQAHLRDADQIIAPTKVTKTVAIDNDNDSSYDTVSKISYYTYENVKYALKSDKNGLVLATDNGTDEIIFGTARRTNSGQFYLFDSEGYNGVGYFDNNKNFVIEYYDSKSNSVITKSFKSMKL